MCNTPTVQALGLGENQIGDAGVTALADACASGSLAQLKVGSQLNGPLPSPWSLSMHTLLTQNALFNVQYICCTGA